MPGLENLSRPLRIAALAIAGSIVAVGAVTWRARRRRWQRRAFFIEYEAAAQGLLPLDGVRPAWRKRLATAQSRYGETDLRTLVLRCRVMAFDELAGDIDGAAEQIDAVLPHVAGLEEESRWLFVVGLHWLAWRRRKRPGAQRCRAAFEALAGAESVPLVERISLGLRLAQAAAQAGRLSEARWILERARKVVSKDEPAVSASPYRSTPRGADEPWSDSELAMEVRCERVRIEVNACDLAGARAALADLDRFIDSLSHAPKIVRARATYWHAMVRHVVGDYGVAERLFAEAALAFEALDDDGAAAHQMLNALAWVDTLLDLQRPEEAANAGRRACEQARTAAHRAQATAVLAAALVQLGQDEEAAALLADGSAAAQASGVVVPTQALLALRRGALDQAQRLAREAMMLCDRDSPLCCDTLLTLGRILTATGRPRLGERTVRAAAAVVLSRLGAEHPQLAKPYRFLAERSRARGQPAAAQSLDDAADRLVQRAAES
ncbi:MAG: hypothetical protein AAF721_15310 [Myxococcota bacterium]